MPATAAGADLGLYPAAEFRVTTGMAAADGIPRQARWYFRDETIAVPIAVDRIASFTEGVRFDDDVRAWFAASRDSAARDYPPLVWTAAPDVVTDAQLNEDATRIALPAGELAFRVVPRIALNRSYFDDSSARFLATRRIKVRGTIEGGGIVARTLWPEEFRLADLPPLHALATGEPPPLALRDRVRADAQGGARSPFTAETLWQRSGTSKDLRGRAVIGIMLNGAQGDDDEAHAGHFALVTGRVQDNGAIGDWLVNNFYTLDAESEKGILAAPVPLDNYLADLNAGQAWYRPSYMLVAALARARASDLLQSALGRVYRHFWRHQLVYHHSSANCTSISVDTMRALGWDVPVRGPTNRVAAVLGFPWLVLKERSLKKAMRTVDYVFEEQTRLLPAAAFEEIGAHLLELAARPPDGTSPVGTLQQMLAADVEALVYLQFPQMPSSRAWGDAPVATLREYRRRLPRKRSALKIVPVPPRPFPESLRDPDLLRPPMPASEYIAALWGCLSIAGIPWVVRRWWRRRCGRKRWSRP